MTITPPPKYFPRPTLRERTRGQWFGILTTLGMNARYLRNKHGPCPICNAGKDRFRWDNKHGDGTYFCNQCGAGSGVDLVMRFLNMPFREAARRIEEAIGEAPSKPSRSLERSEEEKRTALRSLWLESSPVQRGDPVDRWFCNRGIGMSIYPDCLRTAAHLRHSGPPASFHPAMLARVTDPAGKSVMIHKTYVTADGTKAPVNNVRMFCTGSVPAGSAVRLAPPAAILGAAEGIETAAAATRLFGIPVWACLNEGRLQTFEPPAGTERLVVCGDNDANGAGQRAAHALASKLAAQLQVEVRIPDQAGMDWNDVLIGRGAP